MKQQFSSFTEAKQAADDFFNENFGYTNGASYLSEKKTPIKDENGDTIGYEVEYQSADDPAMDDTFKCTVLFEPAK